MQVGWASCQLGGREFNFFGFGRYSAICMFGHFRNISCLKGVNVYDRAEHEACADHETVCFKTLLEATINLLLLVIAPKISFSHSTKFIRSLFAKRWPFMDL